MIERVVSLLREVASELVLPRFGRLAAGEVSEKSPGDMVTIADKQAELVLQQRLTGMLPGSLAVGEEAVAADPSVLERVSSDRPVWLIDPIDGTGNFAAGREPFAMMVTLLHAGHLRLSVMYE